MRQALSAIQRIDTPRQHNDSGAGPARASRTISWPYYFSVAAFSAAAFLAAGFLATAFFLAGAFFAGAFLATAFFLAGAFFAGVFLALALAGFRLAMMMQFLVN